MGDDYSFEGFYGGGVSSFEPGYGSDKNGVPGNFTGYRMNAYRLGFPGSTQTANQIGEAVNAIKQGVTAFEVTLGDANTAEQIPKQHFDEIRALMKITGVTPSVHAPFNVDPAGIGGERGTFEEATRQENERRLFETLQKAKMVNPDGNTPVVFHPTAVGTGYEYSPGKEGEERFQAKKIGLIDKESGQIATVIKEDVEYNPFEAETLEKGYRYTLKTKEDIDRRVFSVNETQWDKQMNNLNVFKKETDELMQPLIENAGIISDVLKYGNDAEKMEQLRKENPELYHNIRDFDIKAGRVESFMSNARLAFKGAFDNAYKYGSEEQRKELKKLAENISDEYHKRASDPYQKQIEFSKMLDEGISALGRITGGMNPENGRVDIKNWGAPKQYIPVEDFAREKATETFSNLAFKSFTELGKGDAEKAPVIAIENVNQMGYAKPEDFKKLVEDSRNKFVDMLVDKKKMEEKEAREVAEKLIGVTWDVGHLNILKKEGFQNEDLIKATKEIQPYVKHVHLTDNFGYSDSHLAPGMGNVPMKEVLKELEKNGRLDQISKIVEAPGFVQHFKRSPHGLTLAAFGSPLYSPKMAPYWNQVSAMASGGGYFGSPLAMFPEKHFSMYGSGFSSLPTEVGGQIPGTGSRFSGTPNA